MLKFSSSGRQSMLTIVTFIFFLYFFFRFFCMSSDISYVFFMIFFSLPFSSLFDDMNKLFLLYVKKFFFLSLLFPLLVPYSKSDNLVKIDLIFSSQVVYFLYKTKKYFVKQKLFL